MPELKSTGSGPEPDHTWMTPEPPPHRRCFVRAQIVQDEMQLLPLRRRLVDPAEELHKLVAAVTPPTLEKRWSEALLVPRREAPERKCTPK